MGKTTLIKTLLAFSGQHGTVPVQQPVAKTAAAREKETDPLMKHIKEMKLPLVRRQASGGNGNCWYVAMADQVHRTVSFQKLLSCDFTVMFVFAQVKLHEIPNKPAEHGLLRTEVCKALPNLPQTPEWIENFFENSKLNFSKFLALHARPGTWTDEDGIICQVMLHIVFSFSHVNR